MTFQPKPTPPQTITSKAPATSALEQALGQRKQVENVMQKYGQQMPKKKPMPTIQWMGDNQG